jgi:predicted permease
MRLPRRLTGGLRALVRRSRAERELDAELRTFLETSVEEKIRRGLSPQEARRAARVEMGSLDAVKDRVRDVGWESIVESIWRDARYAVRSLRRAPGFTVVAILTLSLGIGANTAIFSVIQALLLRPLPVPHADQLVQLFLVRPDQRPANAFSYPFVNALAARRDIFAGVFGFAATAVSVGESGTVEQVDGAWVSGEYYETLGLVPAAGRLLKPDDDRPGAAPVVVITDGYWKRRFGASHAAIGQAILVYGAPVTIVGVTPPGFTGTTVGQRADLTLPLGAAPQIRPELARMLVAGANTLSVMARPREGLSNADVRARLAVAWRQVVQSALPDAPPSRDGFMAARLDVVSASTGWSGVRRLFAAPLAVLMALVGFVLLIACANVAILLLARTAARRREISTRLALGASRFRVTRQLLTESILLSVAGGALGLAFAWSGSQNLLEILSAGVAGGMGPSPGPGPGATSVVLDIAPDATVLLFTMTLAIGTVLLFGTAPAIGATKRPPGVGRDAGTSAVRRGRAGAVLVSAQLALTMLLLVSSGLFVQTLQNLRGLDRGFSPDGVVLIDVDGRSAGLRGAALSALYAEVHAAAEKLPGVRSATYSGRAPLSPGETSLVVLVNGVRATGESLLHTIGPRFFETMRTPLVAGREFSAAGTAAGNKVCVVNEAFAKSHLKGVNPVGQRVSIDGEDGPAMEVVGVVKDVLFSGSVRYLVAPSSVYVPYAQREASKATFEVAVAGSTQEVVASLRRELSARLPNVRIEVRTMADQLDRALVQERLMAGVATGFGVLALLLAVVGLYGVLAYDVTSRTAEIGVRTALGATRLDVFRLVIKGAARPLVAGVAVGLPLTWLASSLFRRMLFGLTPADPWTAAAAIVCLALAGAAAACIPARRAMNVDPLVALRTE